MKLMKIALVSIAAVATIAAPVFAACPDPAPTFGQLLGNCCPSEPQGFCNIQTPGTDLQVRFWGVGQGNFAVDNTAPNCATATCGADNGTWAPFDATAPWVLQADSGSGPVAGKYWLINDWNASGDVATSNKIDGCLLAAPPTLSGKMLIGFSDTDASGNGYFALAWEGALAGNKADFDFNNVTKASGPNESCSGAGNIVLRPVPKPFVSGSSKISTTQRSFTLKSIPAGALSNALYGDNTLTDSAVIQGFKIYQKIVARNAARPSNARSGWTAASGVLPLGAADQTLTVDCATDSDVYFAYSIVADSGFEAAYVGTQRGGQCGPTLADPGKGGKVPRGKTVGN